MNPGLGYLTFFILGWTYYMIATILMKGSLFHGLRNYINDRSENWFFDKLREMLGCLMCTATEAALWTLGLPLFLLGMRYDFVNRLLSVILEESISLSFWPKIFLMAVISFDLVLAIAGEAWVIKTVFEHRERKFLELREEFRTKELELLARMNRLERNNANVANYSFDLEVR